MHDSDRHLFAQRCMLEDQISIDPVVSPMHACSPFYHGVGLIYLILLLRFTPCLYLGLLLLQKQSHRPTRHQASFVGVGATNFRSSQQQDCPTILCTNTLQSQVAMLETRKLCMYGYIVITTRSRLATKLHRYREFMHSSSKRGESLFLTDSQVPKQSKVQAKVPV